MSSIPVEAHGDVPELSEDDVVNGVVLSPDGYVYRPPPPSKQLTIEMQVSVTACTGWREVLATVERFGDLFDFRNTSTAVHRVARYAAEAGEVHLVMADSRFPRLLQLLRAKVKYLSPWGVSDATWGLAKLQCRDDELFRRLSSRARQLLPELDPQGLALTAWAFATIGRQDDELMAALAEEAQRKLQAFGPQNIANLVWATATLGFRCDRLHEALLSESMRRLEDFSAQELAIVNWAFTKLAFPTGGAWRAAFRGRVMRLKEYAPSEVSMIAWALATRGDYDPELMAYVARRSMELMRSFTGQNIATIIWAVATVSYKDDPCIDEFLRMALGAIIARSNEFQPLNIALISWGLAKLAYRAEIAFESLIASAVRQIDQFVPQNLVQVIWACATSGYRDDEFLNAASRVAKRNIQDFSSQHLSNFLWACARLGFKEDTALLRCVGEACSRRMRDGSPQHLSNIAWAISQLGPEHFGGCLRDIVAVTSERLADFDPPSLMMLSDSLYEAKYAEGYEEPLLGILRSHVMRMGNEIRSILTEGLPRHRGVAAPVEVVEYQRRLRAVGLVTFGYEHTQGLFAQLRLAEGRAWDAGEATALPGWTTNARRTTVARRFVLSVGQRRLEDPGTIFTSAFASAAEDAACDLHVVWLGQGKADSPAVGRAGRSGDAECRALLDTHSLLKQATQEEGTSQVAGEVAFHASGVPCLSCVGIAAQFKRCYPSLAVSFTFAQREQRWDDPELEPVMQGGRARPRPVAAPSRSAEAPTDTAELAASGRSPPSASMFPAPPARHAMLDVAHPVASSAASPVPASNGGAGGACSLPTEMENTLAPSRGILSHGLASSDGSQDERGTILSSGVNKHTSSFY